MNNKTTKTTYGNLRYNDEFLTLYGIRTKRVRVCSSVVTDDTYVSFSITSVRRPQPQKVRFMKDAEVEVFVEKTEPNPTPRQKIQSMVMEFLPDGYPSQSARSLTK